MSRLVTIATSTTLALALWQALVVLAALPPFILPGPARVAETLWASRALILEHAGITAAEVVACCDDLAVGFADLSGNNGTEAEVQYLAAQLERSGRSVFAETVNV